MIALDSSKRPAMFAPPVRDYRARAKEALVMQGVIPRATVREPLLPITAAGREAMVDCEHFFVGFKANPEYALRCARTAPASSAGPSNSIRKRAHSRLVRPSPLVRQQVPTYH